MGRDGKPKYLQSPSRIANLHMAKRLEANRLAADGRLCTPKMCIKYQHITHSPRSVRATCGKWQPLTEVPPGDHPPKSGTQLEVRAEVAPQKKID